MDAVHGAADVAWEVPCEEDVEGGKGFDFGFCGIEEGGAKDVHALDVEARFGAAVVRGCGWGGGGGGGVGVFADWGGGGV